MDRVNGVLLSVFGLAIIFEVLLHETAGKVVQLHGAGASFPSEVYSRWIAAYKQYRAEHVTLNMTYNSSGSGAGKLQIKGKQSSNSAITYAGSDISLSAEEQKEFPDLKAFPVMAGAVAIAFNMKGVDHLNLSLGALTGIYNGTITLWNDSIIQTLNPGFRLPAAEIITIARSDKSGTTYSFTSALASSCHHWQQEYGKFSDGLNTDDLPIKWNKSVVDFYGYTNRGMSGLIISIPYSIGYMTVADVYFSNTKFALIQNIAGHFVRASTETVQNAIIDSVDGTSLLNPVGNNSYPIAAYTFFIVPQSLMTDCDTAIEFVRYVDWFYNSKAAQTECEKLYMVPLEAGMVVNVTKIVLKTITCRGKNVWQLFQEIKFLENEEEDSDDLAVYITIASLSVLGLAGLVLFGRQRWKIYKNVVNDTWFIQFSSIHFEKEDINKLRTQTNSPALDPINSAVRSNNGQYAWQTASIKMGVIDSDLVFLIKSESELKTNTYNAKKSLIWFRDAIDHVNIARFVGLTRSAIRWFSIYKGQTRGSINEIVRVPTLKFDTPGLVVLCKDIILGMEYLHKKGIIHGNLKGSCCLVDVTWKVKITDWHRTKFKSFATSTDMSRFDFKDKTNDDDIVALFWVAPELIKFHRKPTYESDVYSFAIVMQEIFSKCEPYAEILLIPKEILNAVLSCCLRPKFSENAPAFIRTVMEKSWEMDPAARPSFHELRNMMKAWYPGNNSLTDCIMRSVEEYASGLEKQLAESKKEASRAQEASRAVLLANAPSLVVERFLNGDQQKSASYKAGTVLACSFVNLNQFVELFSADDVSTTMDELVTGIDQIVFSSNVNRLSMNGEHLLFASEPKTRSAAQVQTISNFAIMLMNFLERLSHKTPARYTLQMKIGIGTGFVFEGVLGKTIPKYTIVGEAVTIAFKMLASARPRTIRLSRSTHDMLKQHGAMFETTILKSCQTDEDENSYWLVSQQGFEGRFDPAVHSRS